MRFLCLTERITTPSRVGSSTGLDEEEDPDREIYKNLWRRRRLLPPKGSQYSKRHRWRTFLLVLVAYEQIYIPLQLAFQLPRPAAGEEFQLPIFQLLLQYTIDVCFMIDMLLVFRTTLLGRPEDGSPIIADTRVISRAYTNWPAVHQGRFMWDLLSCIPLDVCAIGSPGGLLGLTAMWLRCNRLLHALRIIFVYGTHIQKLPRPNKIGVYGILWFFLAHVTACAWWGLGNADFNRRAAADRGIKIWTESISSSGAPVTRDSSLGDQYWSSFYWSVTTLVKVPWVMPETWMEQLYTAVIIIIGTFTFSVIIGQVTMQIKALDNARQARSERVDKMRTFCHTRGVTGPIVSDVLQWTVQDQDFASKYVGRQRLANIPASMRGPLLQMMYSQVLESFPFKKGGMADAGCNALLIKLSPIVLTRGMGLIEPNSIAANLYVLHKGCLRVALPKENVTKGQKSKHMRSARVSTSPIRGVKGGGLGLKSTKDFARFRVLERPGSCVGLADLGHTNARYPFHVDCTTVTQLFQISSNDLKIASDAMSSEDHQKCKEILIKEHKAHVDGLKYEPPEPVAAAPAASDSEPKSPLYTETFFKVDEVLSQATGHLDSLKASRTNTRAIGTLLKQLGGDANFKSTKVKVSAADKAKAANAGKGGPIRGEQRADDFTDELEERTGYSSNVSNANLAAMTRAAIG